MTVLRLFPDNFDPPAVSVPVPPEPVAPVFGEAELAEARTAGFAAGEAAGHTAAATALDARVAATLDTIAARFADAEAAAAAAVDGAALALAGLLLDALGAGFPALGARHGAAELQRIIAAIVPTLARAASVTISVHPAHAAAAAAALAALPPRPAPPPRIAACADVAPGDAVICWGDGRAVRNTAAAWHAVAAVLQPLGLSAGTTLTE